MIAIRYAATLTITVRPVSGRRRRLPDDAEARSGTDVVATAVVMTPVLPARHLEEHQHDHDHQSEVDHRHRRGLTDERLLELVHVHRGRGRLETGTAAGHAPDNRERVEHVDDV